MRHSKTISILLAASLLVISTPAYAWKFWGEEYQGAVVGDRSPPITEWCSYRFGIRTACYCRTPQGEKTDCLESKTTGAIVSEAKKGARPSAASHQEAAARATDKPR